MPMNKVVHAAQRAAFSAAIDSAIKAVRGKGPENMAEQAVKLVNLAQPLLAHRYPDADWDKVRAFVSDPGSKWMEYAYKAINEIDPHILKMNTLNLVYEGMFAGYNYVMELRRKYDCNMPWILLFDPTSACNLHCKGCWAAEYGNRLNLSFEDMDRIVTEGEELGIHWYMCTGGEPTCRKEDLFKLAAKHQNSVFHLFTNGTLIDQAFCDRVKKVGNMAFFISIEGIGDATDDRRGEGVYDRVMHAMDLMKENGLLFGTSICYTSANYKAVTSDEFMDMLISHGVRFNWYFHYMPIGDGANVDLMLNAEQREYMIHRVREIRGYTGGGRCFCCLFRFLFIFMPVLDVLSPFQNFFGLALGIRGIVLFRFPAGNILHSAVSLIFYHQTVTGHGLGDFGFCLQFFQGSSPPIGQRPVSMSAMYLRIGNTCGGETALPSVFIRLLRFGTSSVRRGMSAGSSAQRECPSICAGNPSATLPSPG